MKVRTDRENGRVPVSVMHVEGDIDSSTYAAFQNEAEALIRGGARNILVDLEGAPFVSSAGLRALESIYRQLRALSPDVSDEEMRRGINAGTYRSPHLKLLNPSKAAKLVLEQSGFTMFIEVYTDLKTAVASF